MGANLSVEEKVFKSAKANDAVELQSIIRQLLAAGASVPQYLEFQDAAGQTPIIVACRYGNFTCVEMLLKHGANLHHFTLRPEGSTALHEAVARGNIKVAELLLQYGANPFQENGRGLTCVDIAINKGNVAMVRSLELRSNFTGTLQLKVSKYMGLGAEWKSRWVVIMPRYQLPQNPRSNSEPRVARSLLVCYKAPESCEPVCKVWLDGAVARSVTGSRGSGFLQCALALHRNHALAGGALMTGDATTGYTMHLRPCDGTARGSEGLRRFMEIVNGSRMAITPDGPSQTSTPTAGAGPSRNSSLARIPGASASTQPGHGHTQSDEELARLLQQQYDAEMGITTAPHKRPPSPIRPPPQTHAPSILTGYPPESQQGYPPLSQTPAASTQHLPSRPSAPLYPTIDPTFGGASSSASPGPQSSQAGSPQWYPDTVQAQVPPSAAPLGAGPLAHGYPTQAATTPSAVDPNTPTQGAPPPGQTGLEDDEAGNCVICMDQKATAGFLHGDSVHKCCCKDCATDLKAKITPAAPLPCPMCRKKVEHIIFNFY